MEYDNKDLLNQNTLLREALQRLGDGTLKTIAHNTDYKATMLAHAFTVSAIASDIELKDEFSLSAIGFRPLKGTPILDASERVLRLGKVKDEMHVLDLRPLRPSEKMNLVSSASYTAVRTGIMVAVGGTISVKSGLKLLQGAFESNADIAFGVGFTAIGAALAGTAGYKLVRDIPAIYRASKATTIGLGIPLHDKDTITSNTIHDKITHAQPLIY